MCKLEQIFVCLYKIDCHFLLYRSAHENYGDNAIGYVKLKRTDSTCVVEARLTPETSVNKTPYTLCLTVNETSNQIVGVTCNCQASLGDYYFYIFVRRYFVICLHLGGCKHQTALIFWLLRRTEEPSPTEIACYWKKSVLSTVKEVKSKTIDELCKRSTDFTGFDDSLLKAFIERGKESNKTAFVIRYSECRKKKNLYIDHLMIWFKNTYNEDQHSCNNFLSYCTKEMTSNLCQKIYTETLDQSAKAEWYYQRFARITASRLYEVSNCGTPDGLLVAALMGSRSFKGNKATKRGQRLEGAVFDKLKTKYPKIGKCGILLNGNMPIFGASPDGLTGNEIFEIKCPMEEHTVANYVENGIVKNKVYFQMQLQMMMSNRKKAILVVADPKFEENGLITEFEVKFDEDKLKPILEKCTKFWKENIFSLLI